MYGFCGIAPWYQDSYETPVMSTKQNTLLGKQLHIKEQLNKIWNKKNEEK
jgi:hypothetical protein